MVNILHKNRGHVFYLLIVLFFIVLINGCQKNNTEASFRFVFMTDIHVQPELKGDEGFKQAINKVNQLKPDFVITGGDLVFDALGQSYERAEQLYNMYIDVCNEFNMPIYNTMGNHEVFGLYEKSGINPNHKEYGKKMYKKRTGYKNSYYSFDHKGWHFMILDDIGFTEDRKYIAEIDSAQLEWIKEDLKQIRMKTPIVISVHIPFISVGEQMRSGGTAALSPGIALANSHEILRLFEGYNLQLVLQGHLHIVEEIIYNDVHFITAGAVSGRWWKGLRYGFPEGFAVINVKENDFTWEYETFGWKTVFEEK
jgi:3',5'-cyclic AMP phosphodiesterase CpdA